MPYRTWANADIPSGADFNNMFADPVVADVAAAETTTSASYTDLATAGPAVTLSLVTGQACLVIVSASMNISTGASHAANMSFAVSGASSLAATDPNAASTQSATDTMASRVSVYVAGATGSHTFTAKYKQVNTGTAQFTSRRIVVKKF